jgi:hypothetical protein
MQTIPYIACAGIVFYKGVGYEFKINAIPVAGDGIIDDLHTVALPAMDTIGRSDLVYRIGTKPVAFN